MRIGARLGRMTFVVGLLVTACGPSPSGTTTPGASETSPGSVDPRASCELIDLRSPSGEQIDLTGTWEQRVSDDEPARMWWVRQSGTCVWAVTMSPEFPETPIQGYDLQALRGDVDSSFVIRAEMAEVAHMDEFELAAWPTWTTVSLLIEFDDAGQAVLREDRVAGVEGPLCPDRVLHCLAPIVLTRADQPG